MDRAAAATEVAPAAPLESRPAFTNCFPFSHVSLRLRTASSQHGRTGCRGHMTEAAAMKSLPRRAVMRAVAGLVAAGIATGVALARSTPPTIGAGVVVIETNLAYQNGAAAGTGIVLTKSGRILTNNHVIRGATTIKVVLPGAGRSYTAKVVGYDGADDVAVLQANGAANLKTSALSTSTPVVGQAVTAVGNAGGTGSLTSSRGRITGVGRSISVNDDQGGVERLSGLIETDA